MEKMNISSEDTLLSINNMNLSDANSFSNMQLKNLPLAMAYVPMQKWNTVYNNDVALNRGTIFPELDLPFLGRGGEDS